MAGLRRGAGVALLWLAAWTMSVSPAHAADPGYRFAADPAGVTVDFAVSPESVATASEGLKYLVVADQVLLGERAEPVWHRVVSYQVAEERGLESAGQFSLGYQPAYQRVEIHAIEVWRDGQRLDRRQASRIDVLRRESDLESRLLDGSLTINVTVPDLRLGDTMTYRYSVIGDNPVFGDSYYDSYVARYGVPLGLRHVGFSYPPMVPLRWRAPDDFQLRSGRVGALRTLVATARQLEAVEEEEGTPSSFNAYGRVEVSTARDWRAVSAWAQALYPRRFLDRDAVAPLRERLQLDPADPMGSALRATAFVQGEIRYTGLDMGQNSHAPNPPELTLERRFGDCKDKTTLLIALLSEARIEADPVLVHTEHQGQVRERLPGPLAFNHVIVRARVDGRDVWIDPTVERERGGFASRAPLRFGYGLPANAAYGDLVRIPDPQPEAPQVEVEQTIALARDESRISADFNVATQYRQGFADSIRKGFSADGAEQVGKNYLNYMQGYYEGMRAKGVPTTRDSEDAFHVAESYRLDWDKAEQGTTFGIVLFQLLDWLPKIAERERQAPLALGGPRHGRQTIRVTEPKGWAIADTRDEVKSPYFTFERSLTIEGDTLIVVADWRRHADQVPAADVLKLRKDVARVRELLQYDIELEPEFAFSDLLGSRMGDWSWPAAGLLLAVATVILLWWMRARSAVAGMFYRPHATIAPMVEAGDPGPTGWGLLGIAIVLDIAYEILPVIAAGDTHPAILAGMLVGLLIAMTVRWMIWGALVKFAFQLLRREVLFEGVLVTTGWALLPSIVFSVLAMVALGFDFSLLADDVQLVPAQWPRLLSALALLLTGIAWTLACLVSGYAALAQASRRRSLAAIALAVAMVLLALSPLLLLWWSRS